MVLLLPVVTPVVVLLLQAQLKEAQLNAREMTQQQADLSSRIKELEKKCRNLEGDVNQAQEVSATHAPESHHMQVM